MWLSARPDSTHWPAWTHPALSTHPWAGSSAPGQPPECIPVPSLGGFRLYQAMKCITQDRNCKPPELQQGLTAQDYINGEHYAMDRGCLGVLPQMRWNLEMLYYSQGQPKTLSRTKHSHTSLRTTGWVLTDARSSRTAKEMLERGYHGCDHVWKEKHPTFTFYTARNHFPSGFSVFQGQSQSRGHIPLIINYFSKS